MNDVVNNSGVEPVGSAVLVKPYLVEERTSGGLILPDQVRQKDQLAEQRAVVIAVGPAAWADEAQPRAKVGDKILFSKWAGYQLVGPFDGEIYRVVNAADVFMRITKEK